MKRPISRENFIKSLYPFINPDTPDYKQHFKIKGGRGAIQTFQHRMNEELSRVSLHDTFFGRCVSKEQLERGYSLATVFISGIGIIEIEHEPQMEGIRKDENGEYIKAIEPSIEGLPPKSYCYILYEKDEEGIEKEIAKLSMMEEITPLQEVLEYVESIKFHSKEINNLVEKIEKLQYATN